MKNRKYERYILNADFGNINNGYSNYAHALRIYGVTNTPKTLYGVTNKGSIKVIFSQG